MSSFYHSLRQMKRPCKKFSQIPMLLLRTWLLISRNKRRTTQLLMPYLSMRSLTSRASAQVLWRKMGQITYMYAILTSTSRLICKSLSTLRSLWETELMLAKRRVLLASMVCIREWEMTFSACHTMSGSHTRPTEREKSKCGKTCISS